MSLEAARDLPIPDLVRVLNEKLGLEYTRLQETPISCTMSATSLRSEVSEPRSTSFRQAWQWGLTLAVHTDRKSRNQYTRSSEINLHLAERVTASKQVAARVPFSYRLICSR